MPETMRVPGVITTLLLVLAGVSNSAAQRNNPFSPNPAPGGTVAVAKPATAITIGRPATSVTMPTAEATAKRASNATDIYRIGPGDVLHIGLANAPNATGYYTVSFDGSIDFPLAGPRATIAGMTAGEIALMLSSRVTLYRDAEVQVKVQEFASHKINVTGMVERNGERSLQREAMPLFTIKAVVGVDQAAKRVRIKRAGMTVAQTYDLRDNKTDDILIGPGDNLEFIAE